MLNDAPCKPSGAFGPPIAWPRLHLIRWEAQGISSVRNDRCQPPSGDEENCRPRSEPTNYGPSFTGPLQRPVTAREPLRVLSANPACDRSIKEDQVRQEPRARSVPLQQQLGPTSRGRISVEPAFD